MCTQIKPQSFKQFQVKALKGLKNGAVYEIDYNTKGIPENVVPILDTFIAGKHQKFIGITVINQSDEVKWIPQGQHISTVHLVEGRTPSEEEAQEIIHQLRVHPQEIDEMNTGNTDDFITTPTLDCTGAFHGLRLSPHAAEKSTFITHLGKFEWNVAPFGLVLLPSYYSKAMQDTLSGLEDFARNYMDDILIASYTENEHLDHTRQVFEQFCKFKMKLKLTNLDKARYNS